MTATANFTLSGRITGTPPGQDGPLAITVGPLAINAANASGAVIQIELASGPNVIDVPQEPPASGCVIMLHNDNDQATTLKGVTGDTGVPIGKTGTTMLSWEGATAPTEICLTSAGAQTGNTTTIVFF